MQEEKGAASWTGFLGKLLTFLGAIILILVVLSWLRCGRATPGKPEVNPHIGRGTSSISSSIIGLGKS